jgi:hypothetical protein
MADMEAGRTILLSWTSASTPTTYSVLDPEMNTSRTVLTTHSPSFRVRDRRVSKKGSEEATSALYPGYRLSGPEMK